jgi:glycosyltransferase involved in cell wall biosynthesis
MKVCFFGMDNLPVLAPEFGAYGIGGEQVQQTLLARSLVRRGHQVSMVVYDYGQHNRQEWDGVMTHRAYHPSAGVPILRFAHPRWTNTWRALREADADVYYVSCAGMQLGLLALFCQRYGRKLIFRVAHDSDCDPNNLLIKYWRDKKLYEFGLRRANLILVQSYQQQTALLGNYRMNSVIARMLVQPSKPLPRRNLDVLWVNNIRDFKRPDLFIALARRLPNLRFCMIGGRQGEFHALYDEVEKNAHDTPNLQFLGQVPYHEMAQHYARARVFVNTSDNEGFPNSYLQAWIHGTPTVSFFDPDRTVESNDLGYAVDSLDVMAERVSSLATDDALRQQFSDRCVDYMGRNYAEETIMETYLNAMEGVLHA